MAFQGFFIRIVVEVHDRIAKILALILHDASIENNGKNQRDNASEDDKRYLHGFYSFQISRSKDAPPLSLPL